MWCSSHWSLILVDVQENVVYLANSTSGVHGNVLLWVQIITHILLFKLEVRIDQDSDWSLFSFVYSSVRKLMAAYESLNMDTDTLERMTIQRITVPKQDDGHSCGWRVALNALLLLRSIFQLPSEDVSIFQLPYACVLLFIFLYIVMLILCLHELWWQFPSISRYVDLDVQTFREETIAKLIEIAEEMPLDGPVDFIPPNPRGGIGLREPLRWAPYLGEEPWLHPEAQAYGFSDT